jgi:probable selenium-dependent hydroxylase accessory protein YqeC
MLRLARHLTPNSVIVTSTTKMGESEVPPQEALLEDISSGSADIKNKLLEKKRLFLFREFKDGKYHGFAPDAVAALYRSRRASYVLAEADGARRLPLKGYEIHEPPLPDSFDYQIIVVGVDAFLQPMNERTVARFEIVRRFLGGERNETLTPPLLLKLLTSPDMYMKNSPPETKRILCLNKADLMDPASLAVWTRYLRSHLRGYYGIGITGRGREGSFMRASQEV